MRQLVILLGVAGLAAGVWSLDALKVFDDEQANASFTEGEQQGSAPAPVIVNEARYESSAAVIESVGTGVALKAVTLHSEVAGEVVGVLFGPGEYVDQDKPLLELDARDERLAVELAQVRLDEARQTLARYEQAAPSGAVSAAEVDAARSNVDAVKIELSRAELALRRRTVVAPFAGVMGIAEVEQGDRITETTAIATLDDRSVLLVDFEVPEAFAYGVEVGDELIATTWARPGETFAGRIDSMASRIDPDTRTLRVRASVPNDDDRLRSGMSFIINVAIGGRRLPSVPSVSVQWNREGAFVWRINDRDEAERVAIEVLKRSDDWVLVDAGIVPGDRIVIEGVQRLHDGKSVDIQDTTNAAAPEVGESGG
jgi:RND family efflux transporter MFP subunit